MHEGVSPLCPGKRRPDPLTKCARKLTMIQVSAKQPSRPTWWVHENGETSGTDTCVECSL